MRHRHSRLRLRHKPAHARALLRNLATSVLLYESVRTTKKRAEVVQPMVERLITLAKTKEPRIAIREINRTVTHENASKKLLELLKSRYSKRTSGYTRIVPLGMRHGDGAKMVTLELMDIGVGEEKPTKPKKPKTLSPKA